MDTLDGGLAGIDGGKWYAWEFGIYVAAWSDGGRVDVGLLDGEMEGGPESILLAPIPAKSP